MERDADAWTGGDVFVSPLASQAPCGLTGSDKPPEAGYASSVGSEIFTRGRQLGFLLAEQETARKDGIRAGFGLD